MGVGKGAEAESLYTIGNLMPELVDFCIIAVRINDKESRGKKILVEGRLYPLMKGYDIREDEIVIKTEEASIASLYNYYIGQNHIRNVNISAIVGANGSGKSSLVEFILRLINNMAAALYGEKKLYPSAERIHYINNLYGDLFFMLNKKPHRLNVDGDRVTLYDYTQDVRINQKLKFTSNKQRTHYSPEMTGTTR